MRHFIAYNNDQEWEGFSREHEYKAMTWYSNKSEQTLRESIGQHVWMVSGAGKSPKKFYLHGYYVPSEILPDKSGKGFRICGEQIYYIRPALFVNDFEWFQKLKTSPGALDLDLLKSRVFQ
ncbi:MAG: hypothetical protein HC853_06620 [Anaerolineae bacterium]|nr:hypothetical protein [Anaerolineae bacterium]